MSSIKIKNLVFSYKTQNNKNSTKNIVIDEFFVKNGEIVGFFGPNYVGKTTLLKYISQIHKDFKVSNGSIFYDNRAYDKQNNIPLILYIPQNYSSSIFPWFSIKSNLRIIMKSLDFSKELIEENVKEFCSDFGYSSEEALLKDYGFYQTDKLKQTSRIKNINELSGGQKQILTVLRTLMTSPNIITMDEPFSAIDIFKGIKFRKNVFDYLRKKKITTIIVSHELKEIIELSDKLVILNYDNVGRIIKGIENSNVSENEIETFAIKIKERYNLNYV